MPLTTYEIELFSNEPEERNTTTFLDSFVMTTDASGNASFTRTITTPLPAPGQAITSTAIHTLTGDTSEVSPFTTVIRRPEFSASANPLTR